MDIRLRRLKELDELIAHKNVTLRYGEMKSRLKNLQRVVLLYTESKVDSKQQEETG